MSAQVDLGHGSFGGRVAFSTLGLPSFLGIRGMPIIKSRKLYRVQA